jgi:peptidoglycan/LPS O-acetylase OafA/YrhL
MHGHIPALDGLRALAVLMVLATHFWADPPGYAPLNRLASFGWAGVDLFFVLSGFLITGILWRTREAPGYFRNFYARRTLRIFPLYYAVLAVVLLALPAVASLPQTVLDQRWMYFAYLSNVALAVGGWQLFLTDITWSLAIEEQFYLMWPAVVRWLTRRRLVAVCVIAILLAPLVRFLLWETLGWRWMHMGTPFRLDAFAVGGLAGLVTVPRRAARIGLLVGGSALAALVLSGSFARDSWQVGTFGYSLTALTAGAALILAIETRWLTHGALRHVGTVSYGMYLLHPLCLGATSAVFSLLGLDLMRTSSIPLLNALVALAVLMLVTTGVASLSYRLFEMPFLRLKSRFTPSQEQRVVARWQVAKS